MNTFRTTFALDVSDQHLSEIITWAQDTGSSIDAIVEQLLAGAIDNELQLHEEIRKAKKEHPPWTSVDPSVPPATPN